jgi:hypothetical protein
MVIRTDNAANVQRLVNTLHNMVTVQEFKMSPMGDDWDPCFGYWLSIVALEKGHYAKSFYSVDGSPSETLMLVISQRGRPVFNRINSTLLRQS